MITIDKWAGLVTNASPYAVSPGVAISQVNFQCVRPGELNARDGQTQLSFTTHSATASPIVSVFGCQIAGSESVLYCNSGGAVFISKGLS